MTERLLYKTILMYPVKWVNWWISSRSVYLNSWIDINSVVLFLILFSIGSFICTHIQTVLPNASSINVWFNSQYAKKKRTIKFAYKHHCEAVPTYRVLTQLFENVLIELYQQFFVRVVLCSEMSVLNCFDYVFFWVLVASVNILEILFCNFLNESILFFVFFSMILVLNVQFDRLSG